VRPTGEFTELAELRPLVIAQESAGPVTLGDVAQVELHHKRQTSGSWLDSEPSVSLVVRAKSDVNTLKTVEATGSHTVRVTTTRPDALLLKRLAGWMGQVPCADAYQAAESWTTWGHSVIGTGPYRLAEVQPGEYHRLEAFEDYWGDPAPAASVTYRVVPEMAARIAGLLTGEYDIITEDDIQAAFQAVANPDPEGRQWLLDFLESEHGITFGE